MRVATDRFQVVVSVCVSVVPRSGCGRAEAGVLQTAQQAAVQPAGKQQSLVTATKNHFARQQTCTALHHYRMQTSGRPLTALLLVTQLFLSTYTVAYKAMVQAKRR